MHLKKPKSSDEQVKALKIDAEKLPYGKEREVLERKARQLEMASPNQPVGIIAGPSATKVEIAFGVGEHLSCRE